MDIACKKKGEGTGRLGINKRYAFYAFGNDVSAGGGYYIRSAEIVIIGGSNFTTVYD